MITCSKHGKQFSEQDGTGLAIHLVATHGEPESDAAFQIVMEALSRRGK